MGKLALDAICWILTPTDTAVQRLSRDDRHFSPRLLQPAGTQQLPGQKPVANTEYGRHGPAKVIIVALSSNERYHIDSSLQRMKLHVLKLHDVFVCPLALEMIRNKSLGNLLRRLCGCFSRQVPATTEPRCSQPLLVPFLALLLRLCRLDMPFQRGLRHCWAALLPRITLCRKRREADQPHDQPLSQPP
jgi:hypothetical protein